MESCKCGKRALEGLKHCKKCFLRIFEKRARKELQRYPWFKKSEKVLIIDDGTCKTEILKELVLPLIEVIRIPVKIGKKQLKGHRIVSSENADDVIQAFLGQVLKNKKWEKDELIRPLRQITDEEINIYAELKGFKQFKRKKENILGFVNEMEERYPETKFALLKISAQLLN